MCVCECVKERQRKESVDISSAGLQSDDRLSGACSGFCLSSLKGSKLFQGQKIEELKSKLHSATVAKL